MTAEMGKEEATFTIDLIPNTDIETVAFNRGSGTKAFVDIHQARSWLDGI